jgi:chemotaxis protein MotA
MAKTKSDFSTLFGILAGLGLVITAIFLSGTKNALGFIDPASFMIVFGGTFFVTVACYSWSEVVGLGGSISALILHKIKNAKKAAEFVVDLTEHGKKFGILGLQNREDEIEKDSILSKGVKMLVDGATVEDTEQVISQDIQSAVERNKRSAAILRKAAEISPAMGLIGTLIGLVQMLSELQNPSNIGPYMAIALLTTLYGALFSYMILTPLATKIDRNSDEELLLNKIYLITVVCIGKQESPRKVERLVNTILPPSKRIKIYKDE